MSEILNEQALRHAANQYAQSLELDEPFNRYAANDFKEGAKWQKDQDKANLSKLIELIREAQSVCLCEGFDQLVEDIDNEITYILNL